MKLDMRALVATAPNKFEIQQVPLPKISNEEVLCRIKAVAICGTDPDLFEGKLLDIGWPPKYPFIFGHEWSGEVVEVGENVHTLKVGDRVAGEAHCGCGSCKNCREGKYNLCLNYGNYEAGHRHYGFTVQGAYAEYGAYSPKALTIMPDNVSFEEATMCDTGGVALHAVKIGEVQSCQTVVIIGPGPIGNLVMQICKAKGARTIMVGRRERLNFAKACGADEIINYETSNPPEEVMKLTNGIGADVYIRLPVP
ncbi:MAG: alcohol dehydrogenase catalytic domain-containing protein [Peptostreptococcaceae bacterium]|nr:alcohol dehydrogenase catalytic domain-containing protein [Peptostreptococcaceae bacterium]